jgi:hypothetical protein
MVKSKPHAALGISEATQEARGGRIAQPPEKQVTLFSG